MADKDKLSVLLLNELEAHGRDSKNPLKFIGCTFEDGKLLAVKSYCESKESDERGFYSFGKEKAVSDFKITKELKIEELENEIKSFVERALKDALFSSAKEVPSRIISDLELVLDFNGRKVNPLFDLGVLRDEKGGLKEIKYYLFVEKLEKDVPVDNLPLVKQLSKGVFQPEEIAETLKALGYHPTLFGTNLGANGEEEHKLYFDMGRNAGFSGGIPENTVKALEAVADYVTLSREELEILFENGLYLRGLGLNPCKKANIRLYFDKMKKKRA